MKKNICMYLLLSMLLLAACGDSRTVAEASDSALEMHYDLQFEPADHYINMTLRVTGATASSTLLKMPVWAPGYYLILDSPKHLTQFAAQTLDGQPLEWTKTGKNGWEVQNGAADEFIVTYRLYANKQAVGEAYVDTDKAFLPGNELYLYADGHKEAPATVCIHMPEQWSEACSGLEELPQEQNTRTFRAKDFDTLVDSPVFAGSPAVHRFTHEGHDYTICVAEPEGVDLNAYEAELKIMMSEATRMMGHVPYDNYCYLWLWQGRGGLEHLNSQACFMDDGLYDSDPAGHRRFLNFVTHEYFHLYNVKSIRPFELGPFNYDAECYTDQLWVSEGLTCYYEQLILRRSGLTNGAEMVEDWMEYIRDTETNPGRLLMPLAQSSYDIWLNFFNGDPSSDRISYYVKGPVVGIMMDLAIRQATQNRHSLDDLMRLLYNRFCIEQQRGFHPDEFWAAATEIAEGCTLDDIRTLVYTTEEIDYDKFLGYAGLSLDRDSWTLIPQSNLNDLQQAIRTDIFGDF